MKKVNKWTGLILMISGMFIVGLLGVVSAEMTPEQIIKKLDFNNSFQTSYCEARMQIKVGRRKVTKAFRSWEAGNQKGLIEFTSRRDQGSRVLKLGEELWLFSASAESEIKLSGEMLKQGMMGSDYSYQDALDNAKLLDLYDVKILGKEPKEGHSCYVLELIAKKDVEVSYYRRKIWVDQKRFVALAEELYAPSGKLLKILIVEKVNQYGKRYYPVQMVIQDKLRKNSETRFIIDKIKFDLPIEADVFTRQKLTSRYER